MEGRKEGGQTNSLSFPSLRLGGGKRPKKMTKNDEDDSRFPGKKETCAYFSFFFLACVCVCPPRQYGTEEESPTDTKSISRRERAGREKHHGVSLKHGVGCMNKILCGEIKHCCAFLQRPVSEMIKSPPRWLLFSDGAPSICCTHD